ncbi:MAG: TIGR03960 family B12-binding radical SAM protein [Clostridia bacterium]|nr:TIGR03960 family B12-binding radical SAM protein [Clostridia bacterium]
MELERLLLRVKNPAWYSGGELNSVVKDKETVKTRFAFCFPDLYDVAMSHLGIKILYDILNQRDDIWCERVFAPAPDMEALMREKNVPLFGLESRDAIRNFDFIAFTLQYELSYTNVLNMLDLAGLPVLATERSDDMPVVIAGGPCTVNPEPMADFIDLFNIGEGEETLLQLVDLWQECKGNKREFLERADKLESCYVPALHDRSVKVRRRIIKDLDKAPYPEKLIVPNTKVIHDRISMEIMRGCIRGCRFCQAGMIYRPFRQKSPEVMMKNIEKLCKSTGYDEISLTSLSSSDYDRLPEFADMLLDYCTPRKINLALPSLRIDNFSDELLKKLRAVRSSGLTFAPEAGTQRLRDVINKNITEEDIFESCRIAFNGGNSAVKLYFMIGLPTETDEDILGIADLAQRIVDYYYQLKTKKNGKGVSVTISLSTFVPKPFTPFQWEPQIGLDEIHRRQQLLKNAITSRKIKLNYHEGKTSVLEGVFSRGDRALGKLIYSAWKKGCILDAWDEHFRYDLWCDAMEESGVKVENYAGRRYSYEEELPWDVVDCGVSKAFLIRESKLAYENKTSPNCKEQCLGCGVKKICGGDVCDPNCI